MNELSSIQVRDFISLQISYKSFMVQELYWMRKKGKCKSQFTGMQKVQGM